MTNLYKYNQFSILPKGLKMQEAPKDFLYYIFYLSLLDIITVTSMESSKFFDVYLASIPY